MISSRYRPWHIPLFLCKYAWLAARRRPILVTFEVTMRCNARCGFCDYWQTPAEEKEKELKSFADAARTFNPLMITFSGGEPLLRKDLEDVVGAVRRATTLSYLNVITHGAMLSLDRARSLWTAGIDQFNISLDYVDGRHDTARGIPRLTDKIMAAVQGMRASGIDSIRFNTVIKNDNLDQLMPITERAAELGIGVNFSVYTEAKNGNAEHRLQDGFAADTARAIGDLLAFKRRRRGIITNSDHYLEQIPRYVSGEAMDLCHSGIRTLHVDPYGRVKRCPDFPTDFHWSEYRAYEPIACNECFYACRGEAQAPLRASRVLDVLATGR